MAKLNEQEKNLILIQGLSFFTSGLAGVFVTVFLFAHSDFRTTILYAGTLFASLLVFYTLSGWTLRKISSGALIKVGLSASALYYLLLFFLQERAVRYVMPLAALDGFAGGNFWAAFSLNQYVFTGKKLRARYFGITTAVSNVLRAIAPMLGGAIITVTGASMVYGVRAGYAFLFLLVSLLIFLSVVLIGRLPEHRAPQFSNAHFLSHKRTRAWKVILGQWALWGFYDVSLGTIAAVLTFLIVRSEFLLGVTQAVGFGLGAVGGLLAGRMLPKFRWAHWIGAIGVAVGIAMFAAFQNIFGLFWFIVVGGLTASFLNTSLSTELFHALDRAGGHWSEKYHMMLESGIALGIPRVMSYALLYIFLAGGDQVKLTQQSLYFLPILPLALGFLLHKSGEGKTTASGESPAQAS